MITPTNSHTQGPWFSDGTNGITNNGHITAKRADGTIVTICDVKCGRNTAMTDEELAANINLIKMAPAMLATLKMLVEADKDEVLDNDMFLHARLIIKRAMGIQQTISEVTPSYAIPAEA